MTAMEKDISKGNMLDQPLDLSVKSIGQLPANHITAQAHGVKAKSMLMRQKSFQDNSETDEKYHCSSQKPLKVKQIFTKRYTTKDPNKQDVVWKSGGSQKLEEKSLPWRPDDSQKDPSRHKLTHSLPIDNIPTFLKRKSISKDITEQQPSEQAILPRLPTRRDRIRSFSQSFDAIRECQHQFPHIQKSKSADEKGHPDSCDPHHYFGLTGGPGVHPQEYESQWYARPPHHTSSQSVPTIMETPSSFTSRRHSTDVGPPMSPLLRRGRECSSMKDITSRFRASATVTSEDMSAIRRRERHEHLPVTAPMLPPDPASSSLRDWWVQHRSEPDAHVMHHFAPAPPLTPVVVAPITSAGSEVQASTTLNTKVSRLSMMKRKAESLKLSEGDLSSNTHSPKKRSPESTR